MIRLSLAVIAYLTLIHNVVLAVLILYSHYLEVRFPGGSPVNYFVVPYLTLTSPGALFLIGIIVGTSILALGCLYRTRRREPRETLCRRCGYILRGLATPKCPECGESI